MKIRLSVIFLAAVSFPPAATALDGNGNSQSDVWEMVFGSAGLAPAADADHDGWSNSQESLAGTNPFDGTSFPRLEIRTAGGPPVLRWEGLAGKRYTIESSPNLAGWAVLESGIAGSGPEVNPLDTGRGRLIPTTSCDEYFAELALWLGSRRPACTWCCRTSGISSAREVRSGRWGSSRD